jgi:hypothetical protein
LRRFLQSVWPEHVVTLKPGVGIDATMVYTRVLLITPIEEVATSLEHNA